MSVWIVLGLCAAVVVAIIAVSVGLGWIRGGLEPPVDSRPVIVLPDDAAPSDFDAVRFELAFRGYRMDEVDEVLGELRDRLTAAKQRLSDRDRRIAELEAELARRTC